MKKLSDWDDELIDLDDEPEKYGEDYEESGYGEAYEEDGYGEDDEDAYGSVRFWDRKIIIPAVILIVAVVAVVIAVTLTSGKKKEQQVLQMNEPAGEQTQMQDEEGAENTAPNTVAADNAQETDDADKAQAQQKESKEPEEVKPEEGAENAGAEDPQTDSMSTDQGTEVDVAELLSSGSVTQTDQVTVGIDVARYQGTIDWAQVAASGIDFAMVRV